jgi:hypothetical protein
MQLTIRLSGDSPADMIAFAERVVPLAFAHASGTSRSAPPPPPPHTQNQCDRDGCEFIGEFVDEAGLLCLLYYCPLRGFDWYLA